MFDLVRFGQQDWDHCWTGKQQILSRMAAAGHRILYVNPELTSTPLGAYESWRAWQAPERYLAVKREYGNLCPQPAIKPPASSPGAISGGQGGQNSVGADMLGSTRNDEGPVERCPASATLPEGLLASYPLDARLAFVIL